MKRVGNLFEKVYDIDNLMLAHKNARRGKSFYREVQMVDSNPAKYLYELQDMIKNHDYHTSEYEVFEKQEKNNKVRRIYKLPYYPDRICQWALIQVIEPYLIRTMTSDTYSAIPGRGTYAAYKKVRKALKKDPKGTQWCLKIDIRKYYPNINKSKLKEKYARMFKDKELLDLLYEIIDSHEEGVPIGNYTSQYSGNIFLSDFDHRVKEVYKVKHYFRYMDDMVFFGSTKEELQKLVAEIKSYMRDELDLEVKDGWSLFFVEDRGVDFVGYVFRHNNTRLRKTIVRTLKRISLNVLKRVSKGKFINYHLYCGINSMIGWLRHADAGGLYKKYVSTVMQYVDEYYCNVIQRNKKVRLASCKN